MVPAQAAINSEASDASLIGGEAGNSFTNQRNVSNLIPGASDGQEFLSQLGQNLKVGVVRSLISTAVNGGSLEANLKAGLSAALIDTFAAQGAQGAQDAQGAQAIGDAELDGFTNKLAHALAGCAAGAARTGGQGCTAGAIGAAVGELAAEGYGRRPDTVQFAAMVGGIAAALAGEDAKGINLASQAAGNAAANNYLNHVELDERANMRSACDKGDPNACNRVTVLDALSVSRNSTIRDGLGSTTVAQNLDIMGNLSIVMTGLSEHKNGLEAQLAGTTDPTQRGNLQNQIVLDDNNIRQVANLGKDSLAMLYQQTGDQKYQTAFQALNAATSGNEIAGAIQGAAGIAGVGKKTGTREVAEANGGGSAGTVNLAETQVSLTTKVADLRGSLPSSAKNSGNMGVAEINIPGVPSTMAASSKIDVPTAAQRANGFVGEVPETFPSTAVPTGSNPPFMLNRASDSEAKILNNIAAKLGDNTSATGTINLLTERAPCASCSNVIEQFKAKYPNITVNVFDNGGANIPPTRKIP